VTFSAKATDGLRLKIAGKTVIDGMDVHGARTGSVTMTKGTKTPMILEFTSAEGKAELHLWWEWPQHSSTIVPGSALSHQEKPKIEPIDLTTYKANAWQSINIHADCASGRYTLAVDGRQVLKDAAFAEPVSELYAISLRTGRFRGYPDTDKRHDIPNTEEPLPAVIYRIDDVTTK